MTYGKRDGDMPAKGIGNIGDLSYVPESFCREFVDIAKSSKQLIQFMAVVLGVKKAYDDWIPMDRVDEVKKVCKKYGLHYKFDWIFALQRDVGGVISGGERLPTTKSMGFPFDEKFKGGANAGAHVFFSRSKRDLEFAFRNGWYPLIIKNRAVHKPFIDYLRFGYFLGYPDCCVDFFRRYNNHFRYNFLSEALKNTRARPHIYCNPLLKDNTFSYIYHMPCSYDCGRTIRYAGKIREKLMRLEPGLVAITDMLLAKPFLAIGEQYSYIFEGALRGNEILYSDFRFAGVNKPEEERIDHVLKRGNRVSVGVDAISIYEDDRVILDRKRAPGAFAIQFRGQN